MKEIIIALIPVLGTGFFAFRDVKKHLEETKKEINNNLNVMRAEIIEIKKNQSMQDWLTQIENQMRTLVETCRPFFMHNTKVTKFVIEFTETFITHVITTIKNIELFDFNYICDQGKIDKDMIDRKACMYLGQEIGMIWAEEHTLKAEQLSKKMFLIIDDTVNHKKERVFFESFEFLKYMLSFLNKINK